MWQPNRPARDAQNADVHSNFAMSECDARLCIAGIKSPSSLPAPCSSLSALPPPLRRPAVCCAAFPPSPTPYTAFSPRYGVDAALDAARQTGRKRAGGDCRPSPFGWCRPRGDRARGSASRSRASADAAWRRCGRLPGSLGGHDGLSCLGQAGRASQSLCPAALRC